MEVDADSDVIDDPDIWLAVHMPQSTKTEPAKLKAKGVLLTVAGVAKELQPLKYTASKPGSPAVTVGLSKATYWANDPSEDRSTVAYGRNFVFTGVWDGHGGQPAAIFAETAVWQNFVAARAAGANAEWAGRYSCAATDSQYLALARSALQNTKGKPSELFAGTCAVMMYADLKAQTLSVSNLGDCRAVMGLYPESGGGAGMQTVPLSSDHIANDPVEKARIKQEHPGDHEAVVNCGGDEFGEEDDWRVKGVCAFSRSLGDFQLKDSAAATVYNTYTQGYKIEPRPGIVPPRGGPRTMPYIINEPVHMAGSFAGRKGFAIVACDGLWDEMSSDEAVEKVAELLTAHPEPEADIANMLIEFALTRVVERLRSTVEEESTITLEDLKSRKCGKDDWSWRSCLHDDITAVVMTFDAAAQSAAPPAVAPAPPKMKKAMKKPSKSNTTNTRRRGSIAEVNAVMTDVKASSGDRFRANVQIAELIDVFAGMHQMQLQIVFDALDVDRSGALDRPEVQRLVAQVLGEDVPTELIEAVFSDMDADGDGHVAFIEFVAFFGVAANAHKPLAARVLLEEEEDDDDEDGRQGWAGARLPLLRQVPLLQALAGPELEALAQALKAVEFEPGEPVVRQGDPGDAMYFIEAGAATAEIDGKVVRDYSSGDYFGELALMSNQPRSASVIARGSAKLRLLALPQRDFEWLVLEHGDIKSLLDTQAKKYTVIRTGDAFESEDPRQALDEPEPEGKGGAAAAKLAAAKQEIDRLRRENQNLRAGLKASEAEVQMLKASIEADAAEEDEGAV